MKKNEGQPSELVERDRDGPIGGQTTCIRIIKVTHIYEALFE